jgi:hypothetical protein
MKIRGLETHGFAELLTRSFTVACFQEGVGEVLADVGPLGRKCRRFFEEGDRSVIVAGAQGVESLCERFIRGIFRFLSQRGGGDQAKRCEANGPLPDASVGLVGKILH